MTIYNWISLALILIGWAVTYGKLCQKINQMEKRQDQVDADVKALRAWGEAEITKQIAYREAHYVGKEIFLQCTGETNRRLDTLDALELGAQLAEIKAMLVALKEQVARQGDK